mmetsp:Transcript_17374/g.29692  ORF Transcript_17374/g.29692 Transcript_17374/m.29692 type:complete len:248 (+) Transcript_17374:275-1018(+)
MLGKESMNAGLLAVAAEEEGEYQSTHNIKISSGYKAYYGMLVATVLAGGVFSVYTTMNLSTLYKMEVDDVQLYAERLGFLNSIMTQEQIKLIYTQTIAEVSVILILLCSSLLTLALWSAFFVYLVLIPQYRWPLKVVIRNGRFPSLTFVMHRTQYTILLDEKTELYVHKSCLGNLLFSPSSWTNTPWSLNTAFHNPVTLVSGNSSESFFFNIEDIERFIMACGDNGVCNFGGDVDYFLPHTSTSSFV